MSVTRPALRAQMGTNRYFLTSMPARELATSIRPASETDSWASSSIDERMQRELNQGRIKKQIVPYLASHPDRFFGAFIALAPKGSLTFEPIGEVVNQLPGAYRNSAQELGFLTIGKGELIALDGQHRLMSFRDVISEPTLGPYAAEVGDDEVSVIFLEFESSQKTRRIFSKVNRHAKPTGRSDNIITSEDDGFAIITRRLLDKDSGSPLADREVPGQPEPWQLVNWQSNTLSARSTHLTTISALYEGVKEVILFEEFQNFSEQESPVAPSDAILDEAYEKVLPWVEGILSMDAFRNALENRDEIPNVRFSTEHPHALLLRPAGLIALFKGLVRAIEKSGRTMSLEEALRRANKIDWSAAPGTFWRDSIIRADGRMVARKEAYDLAARLIVRLIADEYMDETEKQELWKDWNSQRGKDVESPFDEVMERDEALVPEDLPEPVALS